MVLLVLDLLGGVVGGAPYLYPFFADREGSLRCFLFSLIFYQIAFPRPGPLGLNLRSYFAEPQAGARPGLPPYGCLELLEAQSVYLQVRD